MTSALRVAVFVGTRADLGPLTPVLRALAERPGVAVTAWTAVGFDEDGLRAELAATGTDAGVGAGLDAGVGIAVRVVGPRGGGSGWSRATAVGADLSAGVAAAIDDARPDVLVVLGDRWELLYAVPPAVLQGVPVVHLHGGEVTEGAVDERVRHAVSKLSDQHCTATASAAARLRRMGEPADRVHVTGAPGLDRLRGARPLAPGEFTGLLGVPLRHPVALVTVHPATATRGPGPGGLARAVLDAVTAVAGTTVVTHPGQDPGREEVLAVLAASTGAPGVVVRPSLGRDYPRVLATADVVVGNSSSGVIEAACLGVPAVDVGDRQAGRERGDNVVTVDAAPDAVRAGLARALDPAFRARAARAVNPYGSGRAAGLVADVVLGAARSPRAKAFADACAPLPSVAAVSR